MTPHFDIAAASAPPGDGNSGARPNPEVYFKRQRRTNATHASTTGLDALLYRRGPGIEAKLCYVGHGLMENRSGLIVDTRLTRVSGHAERLAALEMIERWGDRGRAITPGTDRGYDARDFVAQMRDLNVRLHVAQNTRDGPGGRHSVIDRRTTRYPGYAASQRIRK